MTRHLSDRLTGTGFIITYLGLMALLLLQNLSDQAEETIQPFVIVATVIGAIVLAIGRLSPVSKAALPDHSDKV